MGVLVLGGLFAGTAVAQGGGYGSSAYKPDCTDPVPLCTEVANPAKVFGRYVYVGHDEPSLLFYSNVPGSGNQMQYTMTLPKDPPATPIIGRSYEFELNVAGWFGMALCDTQSYPLVKHTCTADSDSNITPQTKHAGTAFMELQFYPPGWVSWFDGPSCSATQWCSALNIDSLSENGITGKLLNATCQAKILGGPEYINFAFLTHSGVPQGPPNPLQFSIPRSGVPNPQKDLFMNGGDTLRVTIHDTPDGLQTIVDDLTTGQSGSMTASAKNGFGQIKYEPEGKSCTEIPYNFHPMYSTSSPQTRVIWAAHTYNIAYSGEIGHFDWCTKVTASRGCDGLEGEPGVDQEPHDADDIGCFPASDSLLYPISGCEGANAPGFDGAAYLPLWPDGNTNLHPTPQLVSSPLTGASYNVPYSQVGFETDTPRIQFSDFGGICNPETGADCPLVPITDDGVPASFYPFYTTNSVNGACEWSIGNVVPGLTTGDFGGVTQYGKLLAPEYLLNNGTDALTKIYTVYRNILPNNPCP